MGVRRIAQLVMLALSVTVGSASVSKSHPYRKDWKHVTFGKEAVGRVAVGAGIGQATGHPHNYGGGMAGFGKRVGAGFGSHAIGTTVGHAIAAPLHENLHYQREGQGSVGHRLGHALKSTVVATNTRTGKHQPAVGRLSGHAASGAASQALFHAGSGAATAGVGIGAEAGANVAREFWPRHRKHRARL